MMRFWFYIAWLGLFLTSLGTAKVSAQEPDIRNIRPHVMLLVDTSGSMERKPNCLCTTPACLECLPVCSAGSYEENRWALVAQALSGEFSPYECNADTRIGGIYSGQYDEGYFLPHIQLPQEIGSYAGTQNSNGILDIYLERIKFGLMTFDAIGTLSDRPPLVTQADFGTAPFPAESLGTKGMYSYGDNKPFSFPGALTTYMLNSGARSASAPEGGLVSVGGDSTAAMTSTNAAIQATVLGDTGLGKNPLRPFGATPTAALVSDLEYFLQTDGDVIQKTVDPGPGDPYYGCRARSAVLITDGFPNGDMRGSPVNCELLGQPVGLTGCPYEEIADTVTAMITAGELDKFYVIGFALDGDPAEVAAVEAFLDDLASVGNSTEAFFVADRAELVTALSTILNEQNPGATSRTAPVLTGLTPGLVQAEFISGFNASFFPSDPWDGVLERRRIECVGGVPVAQNVEDSDRFQLVLNGQVAAPGDVEPWASGVSANFTGGFSRNLWTVLPADPTDINSHLVGNGKDKLTSLSNDGIDVPADSGLEIRNVPVGEFSKAVIPEYFGLVSGTDDALRDTIVDFVHGVPGSDREDERLGDIYHSTPAIVGPLVDDLEDRSFNDWRLGLAHQLSPDPLEDLSAGGWQLNLRPRVIYASTNDGVLHAFLADDYGVGAFAAPLEEFACAENKNAGTELWGFIPPMFLDDLDDLLSGGSKQWFADGSIVVRNLYDVRSFAEDDGGGGTVDSPAGQTNVWRTVLFVSFRNGGQGMVALDVTNPCKPEFLWQFTEPNLGDTYGQPTAAQIFLRDSDPTPRNNSGGPIVFEPRQSHGVIILPGGQGVEDAGSCAVASGPALPEGMKDALDVDITPRASRRCWRDQTSVPPAVRHGRALYFIDLMTGSVIRKLNETTFPAPLNGAVSVFRGDTATVGSVAYTVDADGVLWRIDMASADPEDWNAEALHDLYYADGPSDAEPSYYPPSLSVDGNGNVVILTGTGNLDVLDDATAKNQVVSITERLTFDVDGKFVDTLEGRLNWEIKLDPGEQMTGPVELFGGQVYFGSFKAGGATPLDACPFGGSRIFGLRYLDDPTSPGDVVPLLKDALDNPTEVVDQTDLPILENSLLVGLQVAQQPVCTQSTASIMVTDPFLGTNTLAMPWASSGRQFKLMAHLSGSSGSTGGLSINILEEAITAPEGFTVVSGMAETLE
ncbi:MAG: PilC/PilY family type IV pilus protein [Myxococcales bacterium]|nr:PilC/PilY family type IV pilus protein [Myxococcales bacterium]